MGGDDGCGAPLAGSLTGVLFASSGKGVWLLGQGAEKTSGEGASGAHGGGKLVQLPFRTNTWIQNIKCGLASSESETAP